MNAEQFSAPEIDEIRKALVAQQEELEETAVELEGMAAQRVSETEAAAGWLITAGAVRERARRLDAILRKLGGLKEGSSG